MSEKTPTEKLRELLNEMGVEYDTSEDDTTIFYIDGNRYTYNVNPESGWAQLYGYNLTPEQAIAVTVGKDIEHYDGSGRRGTVAILQGGREPEEVMFIPVEGGVTHYLPEGAETCHMRLVYEEEDADGFSDMRDIVDEMEEENAKLRELLQEAVDGISTKDIRDWRFGKRLAFLRKARELGIEVCE